MINEALLRKTMEKIEELPAYRDNQATEVWNQYSWITVFENNNVAATCGTAACFAGWAAILDGAQIDLTNANALVKLTPELRAQYPEFQGLKYDTIHVSEYSRVVLGLHIDQASRLFWAGNDKEDLRKIVDEFIELDHE